MQNKALRGYLHVVCLTLVTTAMAETAVQCEPLGSADTVQIAPDEALSSDCGAFLDETGAPAQFCQWKFDYRSDAAQAAFSASELALDGCFNKTLPSGGDVNHPDSYDQIFYTAENKLISLSLKDKAQQQATYLFLRIETAP